METLFDVAPAAVNGDVCGDRRDTGAYGAVAEQLAIAELLRRGHKVAVPVVDDDGVDLVVNYSVRVQVKSAHRKRLETVPGYGYQTYSWNSKRGWCLADVFLLYGRSPDVGDRWWVVPQAVVASASTMVNLYEGSSRGISAALASYEGAWGVFGG